MRAASGAFGFGFGHNVRDLYEFLVKNYDPGDDNNPGDRVYLFGFSRGAATVRAFSGFVAACGLIRYEKKNGEKMNARELKDAVKEKFREYIKIGRQSKKKGGIPPLATASEGNHGAVPIKFIGVWDTVSALGFPQRTDVTGIGMWVINLLLVGLDHLSDLCFPHRFYNYELTDNVDHACQALAIDDERTSFWPMVWDETVRKNGSVEQVWFAGMHSNVGGGYQRAGLANVAHEWMIFQPHLHGLKFKNGTKRKAAEDAHVQGRLYNSRDGAAIYYRYHPREIEKLCKGDGKKNKARISGTIKIHESVIRRMEKRTANYAPTHLPDTFETVATEDIRGKPTTTYEPHKKDGWQACRAQIDRVTLFRKWLYGIFLEFTLVVVVSAGYFWIWPPLPWGNGSGREITWSLDWWTGHLADILNYVLPDFFGGLITVAIVQKPEILGWVILVLGFLIGARIWARRQTIKACEKARDIVVNPCSESVPE